MYNRTLNQGCGCGCQPEPFIEPRQPFIMPERVCTVQDYRPYIQPIITPVRTHYVHNYVPRYVNEVVRTTSEENNVIPPVNPCPGRF